MAEKLRLKKENAGSYVLVIHVKEPFRINAGKLLERELEAGIYLYIGRAKKFLRGRLFRHLRAEKKLFWHIDYLLREQEVSIAMIYVRLTEKKIECVLADEVFRKGEPKKGFGCSDCTCYSHLFKVDCFSFLRELGLEQKPVSHFDKRDN